jgi:hypothetical protein
VLDQDHSCRAAVMRLVLWMALNDRKPCSTETTSYCEARRRLPLKVIVRLVHATAEKIEASANDKWIWKGRRISLVDGTTASMPDTPEDQRAFRKNPGLCDQGWELCQNPLRQISCALNLASSWVWPPRPSVSAESPETGFDLDTESVEPWQSLGD